MGPPLDTSNPNTANMMDIKTQELVAMVSNMQIDMITELIQLNMVAATKSFDWWLDFGATIHVCNGKSFFNAYEKAKDDEEVRMGNSNYAKVLRKGSVELQFTSGKKLTLLNVFLCPRN